ncbi:three-Cys-motif partner protein TcmP [Caulobacter sp.]|uniref:three-Cys-motif partner protein TcmP n=1 Tax=Caulobacter sp. TaxID=78 RepID=UPI001B2083D9|nr:three-Cys-motif partner protein TcmP [Caulobacter sp.]MBO9545644.1 three-Cys-motif partner protein TcmP [Caulobacter sp.]
MKTAGYDDWVEKANLDDHSRRKHKILREYFRQYLLVRCQLPSQERFRIAIVDGFAGGGRYNCGASGSPLIFLEELESTLEQISIQRAIKGMKPIEIEAMLVFNDASPDVVELLRSRCEPLVAAIKDKPSKLHIRTQYFSDPFELAYPAMKAIVEGGRYRSVIFNLDQYGHADVQVATVQDIMRITASTEVFYTFAVQTLMTYLSKRDPALLERQLRHLSITSEQLRHLDEKLMSKKEWLGAAEKTVYEALKVCAPFVSPFSIRNPDGWRYWMLHLANNYRARQVYNNVLHDNGELDHFGRSGLRMFNYNPANEGRLYLFEENDRVAARDQLHADIPNLVMEAGDVMTMSEFYETAYSATPAHKDDIHAAMLENEDLEVLTPEGGVRRKGNTISVEDTLRLKKQRSFFPMFGPKPKV